LSIERHFCIIQLNELFPGLSCFINCSLSSGLFYSRLSQGRIVPSKAGRPLFRGFSDVTACFESSFLLCAPTGSFLLVVTVIGSATARLPGGALAFFLNCFYLPFDHLLRLRRNLFSGPPRVV